ncbi:hypothetical protein MCP_1147 [Methanocella paludicola SANAE]|uniref:Uncharacterized protein n=2 Tax=Methanocella TaxID=570266 RepID=D1YXP7_METPS|nr:hypothetical protein MCP_1147 [Methanocella paludicola SANAE]
MLIVLLTSTASILCTVNAQTLDVKTNNLNTDLQYSENFENIQYGECIDMSGIDPVVRDLTGTYKISDNKDGTVDIIVSFKTDDGKILKETYKNIPVIWKYHMSSDGRKIIDTIDIMDWTHAVYACIDIANSSYGLFHIAINTEHGQYSASGYIKNPLSIKYKTAENYGTIVPISQDGTIEVTKGNPVKFTTIDVGSEKVYAVPIGDLKAHNKTIIIKNKTYSESTGTISPMSVPHPTTYGIVEEAMQAYELTNHHVPTQIPTWLMNAGVDYAFYRNQPDRATVISDIDYYTRLNRYDDSKSRILSVFEICCHGADGVGYTEPDRILCYWGSGLSVLYPSDVTNIFQTQHTDYINSAGGCIAFFHVCEGLWDNKDANGNYLNPDSPEMGHAWVDYGASAYMSFTGDVNIAIDTFENTLWNSICSSNTVGTAWNAAYAAQNPGCSGGIWGNSGATLFTI